MPGRNQETFEGIVLDIRSITGEDPIQYIYAPAPGDNRVVWQDGTVSLGWMEAAIHAAAIRSKLSAKE